MYDFIKETYVKMFYDFKRIEIRDVDNGEDPFLYSTGNHGPGYVDVKGGVGIDEFFEMGCRLLSNKLFFNNIIPNVIVGMMTGGALPAYRLKQLLSIYTNKKIAYIYQRGARKQGGHGELDTGVRNNPYFNNEKELDFMIVEELVNFAGTTTNGVLYERSLGRKCNQAACLLFYENPVAIKKLKDNNINLTYVVTLPEILIYGVNNNFINDSQCKSYMNFLKDPKEWNLSRGYEYHE